jgi:hypothetical protein
MPDIEEVAPDAAIAPEIQIAPEAPQATPDKYEVKARELNWRPLAEFEGDPEEWVDAKEFIKRAPLFERLKSQGKKLKEQEKALHDMAGHIDKVAEASYKRAIADLNREKRQAVEEADPDRVAAIDTEIEQIRGEMAPKPATDTPAAHPAVTEWLDRKENQWFKTDKELAAFAISYQNSLFAADQTLDMEESLVKVTKAVKRAFPEKFSNPARQAAPSVETAVSAPAGKKVFSFRDLNDEQRSVAARFERMGIMKKDEYVKQLADSGQLGG